MNLNCRRLTLMAIIIVFATVITLVMFSQWVTLELLTIISVVFAVAILIDYLIENGAKDALKFLLTGAIVGIIDFLIEYLGTSTSNWAYFQSNYYVFGLVPLELPLLFFAGGIMARHVYIWSSKFEKPIKSNTLFFLLILLGTFLYTRAIYLLESPISILYVAAPIGLWGICNIPSENNRVSALVFATLIAAVDTFAEMFVIHSGGYDYVNGFSFDIPIIYALFALGVFGLMEKMDVLDRFFEHPLSKSILRTAGVKRNMYRKKVRKTVKRVREKANHIIKK